jgi:hypothetical protein
MKYGMNDSKLYFVVDTRLLQKRWPILHLAMLPKFKILNVMHLEN